MRDFASSTLRTLRTVLIFSSKLFSLLDAVPFTARMPIRITIRGHIYDITRLRTGINESCRITLTLVVRQTCFSCVTTTSEGGIHLGPLLFRDAVALLFSLVFFRNCIMPVFRRKSLSGYRAILLRHGMTAHFRIFYRLATLHLLQLAHVTQKNALFYNYTIFFLCSVYPDSTLAVDYPA